MAGHIAVYLGEHQGEHWIFHSLGHLKNYLTGDKKAYIRDGDGRGYVTKIQQNRIHEKATTNCLSGAPGFQTLSFEINECCKRPIAELVPATSSCGIQIKILTFSIKAIVRWPFYKSVVRGANEERACRANFRKARTGVNQWIQCLRHFGIRQKI